ncbi:hypothetical protein [Streptomyces sp. NRRL F-5053]|uniref:hypothetical protein n=1 Tax=Streptomyces sp. NRRL F-5053 TaxID=1463854 RepID=UPI000A568613|nr:hypothetical protein [Streptomyces sp. NRRL F-5053]
MSTSPPPGQVPGPPYPPHPGPPPPAHGRADGAAPGARQPDAAADPEAPVHDYAPDRGRGPTTAGHGFAHPEVLAPAPGPAPGHGRTAVAPAPLPGTHAHGPAPHPCAHAHPAPGTPVPGDAAPGAPAPLDPVPGAPAPDGTAPDEPAPGAPAGTGGGPEADGPALLRVLHGRRRAAVAGVVGAVVFALAGAVTLGRWLVAGEQRGPLADRPRVTDGRAGLSYPVPEGWTRSAPDDLVPAFTSSVTAGGRGGPGGLVAAGRSPAVSGERLRSAAERAARSNAAFFFPDGGSRPLSSHRTEVDGHRAHTVTLRTRDGRGGTGTLRLTLVSVDAAHAAFLLGVAPGAGPSPAPSPAPAGGTAHRAEIDAVFAGAEVD